MRTLNSLFALLLLICGAAYSEVDLEIVWQTGPIWPISEAKWSADGRYIYCATGKTIRKMDATNGEWLSTFDYSNFSPIGEIISITVSKSGNLIATSSGGGGIFIWDTKSEKCIEYFKLPDQQVGQSITSSFRFLPDEHIAIFVLSKREKEFPYRVTEELIKYDFRERRIIQRMDFSYDGLTYDSELSHDGLYFAKNKIRREGVDGAHSSLKIWDAQTFKQIAVLDERNSGDGVWFIKFSKNDRYLATSYRITENAKIFDLTTMKVIKEIEKNCFNIEILPDNIHSLINFADVSGWYELQLHNFEGKIKTYYLRDDIIESYGTPESWKIFYGGERDTFYLLRNITTGVEGKSDESSKFEIITESGKVILKFEQSMIEEGIVQVSIYDIVGKMVFSETIEQIPADGMLRLNAVLGTGVYVLKLNINNKEYSHKFQIVR